MVEEGGGQPCLTGHRVGTPNPSEPYMCLAPDDLLIPADPSRTEDVCVSEADRSQGKQTNILILMYMEGG